MRRRVMGGGGKLSDDFTMGNSGPKTSYGQINFGMDADKSGQDVVMRLYLDRIVSVNSIWLYYYRNDTGLYNEQQLYDYFYVQDTTKQYYFSRTYREEGIDGLDGYPYIEFCIPQPTGMDYFSITVYTLDDYFEYAIVWKPYDF